MQLYFCKNIKEVVLNSKKNVFIINIYIPISNFLINLEYMNKIIIK